MTELEAYRLMRAGNYSAALPLAERAVAGKSSCLPAHGLLVSILLQLGRATDAENILRQVDAATGNRAVSEGIPNGDNRAVSEGAPSGGTADAYDALAWFSLLLRDHQRGNRFYRRATELEPQTARYWYNLACSERSLGRLVEAEAACDRAIAADPAEYPSYLLRSELRVQSADANHVDVLQGLMARPDLEHQGRLFVGYALAKELDDLARFDEAFKWFSESARVRRSRLQYDIAADEHKLRRIAEVYSGGRNGGGDGKVDSSRYIFIVGLPRTGTTLVERILSGLPDVVSNGETENFSRSLLEVTPPGSADIFARAALAAPEAVASGYARRADGPRTSAKIIEKLPMNYLYVGAIRQALPEARVILLKRSPLDSCFAMYRTLFREAYPFSYDFDELGRYYAAYERLVQHWRRLFGNQVHEVVYEDLVREPRRVGADIASHCGVPWSDAAIEIQNNAAVSLTASAAQIRRPIYGTSSGRWRLYRSHLDGLANSLRRHGVTPSADV